MDKIKKVFSPGHHKDDEVLYQNQGTSAAPAAGQQQEAQQLHPVEGAAVTGAGGNEHGVRRQILNPGGDKYDTQLHGTTATTDASKAAQPSEYQYGKGEHTILNQITNPGGDKYDPHHFSDTPAAPVVGDAQLQSDPGHDKKHEHSILRQILNPGGAKYDQEAYGTTAHVVGDSNTTGTTGTTGTAAHPNPNTTTGPN